MAKMNYREFKDEIAEQIHGFFSREVRKEDVRIFSVEEQDMFLDKFQIVGAGATKNQTPVVDLHSWYKEYVNQYDCNFEDAIYYMARRYEKLYHEALSKDAKSLPNNVIAEHKVKTVPKQETTIEEVAPRWISRIDNLINALEIYRNEEAKAIHRLEVLLAEQGIHISGNDMKDKETEEIREKISEEQKNQQEQERVANEKMNQQLKSNQEQMKQMQETEAMQEEEKSEEREVHSRGR